jgi:hypothetical protein
MKLLEEYYMWTEIDKDGEEGAITAIAPDIGILPLTTRNKDIATGIFREFALHHNKTTKHQVRLVHWTVPECLEVIGKVKGK